MSSYIRSTSPECIFSKEKVLLLFWRVYQIFLCSSNTLWEAFFGRDRAVILSIAFYLGPTFKLCFLINSRRNRCIVHVLLELPRSSLTYFRRTLKTVSHRNILLNGTHCIIEKMAPCQWVSWISLGPLMNGKQMLSLWTSPWAQKIKIQTRPPHLDLSPVRKDSREHWLM